MALRLSQGDLAELFGVAPSTVVNWEQHHGLPIGEDTGREKFYPAAACVLWFVEREVARRGVADPGRARYVAARAAREELELARRLGEVVSSAEVAAGSRANGKAVSDIFLRLPAKAAPQLVGLPLERLQFALDAYVKKALGEAAEIIEARAAKYDATDEVRGE